MAIKSTAAKPAPKSAKAPTPGAKASPPKNGAASSAPATVSLKQIAATFAEKHDIQKKQAETMLGDVVGYLVEHLISGDRVRIGGLGILEVKSRPARAGRNPATGAAIQIAASKKVAFRAAKELKEAVLK